MRRIIKKIFRYLFRTLLVVLLLLVVGLIGFYIYINTGAGRRELASQISKQLKDVLGNDVQIGSATWNFPAEVSLDHVIIKDHKQHDMFNIEKLEAGLAFYNFVTGRITFSEVTLKNVNFDLIRYKGDSSSNFGFVINRLTPSGGDTSKHTHTDIMFNAVNIENMHFMWDDQTLAHSITPGIDWDHLDVKNFNSRFTYVWIDGTDVSAKVKRFSLQEKSGFVINNLQGIATYTSDHIEVKSLDLLTPYSEVGRHIRLDYKNLGELSDFVDKVQMTADFSDSKVSFKDLAFFTPDLKNKTDSVMIANLEATGKVTDINIHDIDASFGSNSFIKGKVELKGLPNIDETFIAVRTKQTRTSRKELQRLMPEIELPDALDKLGNITMKGNFTGFINDFVAFGDVETDIGNVSTDLNMKITRNLALCTYSGKVSTDGFNIGALSGEPLLGRVSLNGQIKGKGLSLESVNANLVADVSHIDFNKYNYQNIKINGNVASKFFNGSVVVNDKNLALDFKGTVDYTKQKPDFNFFANVTNANLYALNLAKDSVIVASTVRIDLHGIKPDDIDGQIFAKDTRLFLPDHTYHFDSISVKSTVGDHHRDIEIYSDLVKGNINGDFQLSRVGDLLKSAANRYIDTGFLKIKVEPLKDQYVNFDLHFQDLSPVFALMRTKGSVSDSGYLKGSIYANESKIELEGSVPEINYKDLHFKNVKLKGEGNHNNLTLNVDVGAFVNEDTLLVRDAKIQLRSNTDKLFFDVYGADQLRQKQAWVRGSFDVDGKIAFLDLDSSKLQIVNDVWHMSANRITFYKDTMMDVPLIALQNGKQTVRIAGQYSRNTSYPIRIVLENLGLSPLATFVPEIAGLSGGINGQVLINNLNTKPIIEAAVYVEQLAYQKDTLGTLSASTTYNENTKKLSLDTKLETGDQKLAASAKGDITIDQHQALDMIVNLNKTDIKVFEPFLNGIFSELKGEATADIDVKGTLNEPIIKGSLTFNEAELKVVYTNCKYHFSHTLNFAGRVINIKNLDMYDVNNNMAVINGKFDLSHLDNVKMNIDINANKFQALNTTQKLNDLYFGKAYGTGLVSISGPLDNLKFIIKMKTDKNTTFSMPISQGNTFYGHDYIKFINKGNYLIGSRDVKISGIELSMDLEITPDAYGQIIFDPRVGDIIEAHGYGNLRLDVNSDGDFNMFGTYSITDGKYRFTAFDVINKAFVINPGSTIAWNGNPYEAQLNVEAVYTVRTTLLALQNTSQTQSTQQNDNRVYPVDAILNLKGSLYQPEIKLDFNIRELYAGTAAASDIETHVRQIKSNEQDLNQQVVSLLVLNQFAPTEASTGGGIGVGGAINSTLNSSVGDLVSNQLNYMISNYSEDLHVGIDYRTQEEATLRISQDIFKQRANISASYDVINNNYNTQLSYKIRKDGSVQGKVFGRSNNDPVTFQSSNTQGVGILYRREFDKVSELFRKRKIQPKPAM